MTICDRRDERPVRTDAWAMLGPMESSAAGTESSTCPKCAAPVAPGERFCSGCGNAITEDASPVPAQDPPPAPSRFENLQKIGKARKWLLAVAIITFVAGLIFFAINKDEVEKQIDQARLQVAGMDPVELDRRFKQAVGMTFQEAIDHDRGMVNMMLAINLGLAAVYMLLWWWAKRKPLPASIIALLLFITTNVINAVIQPSSIYQGLLLKIFFTLALVRAIYAANEERGLGATTA